MSEPAFPTCEPARFKTQYFIDSHAFRTGMSTSTELRQKSLLEWLSSPDADSTDIIRWMQGVGFELQRQEDPALVLIRALPAADNFCEPVIREVLSKRIGEAVIWLATDDSENCVWNRLAEDTWIQLFVLIRRLGVSSFKPAVMHLFQRCEREGRTPFNHDSETARMLTRFVMVAQPDSELENRWVGLIKGQEDPVLKASLFDAFRGLLSMPDQVKFARFEKCIAVACDRLSKAYSTDELRKAKADELMNLISRDFPSYGDLAIIAFARFWNDYVWLQMPNPLVFLVATIRDLGVIAQIHRALVQIDARISSIAWTMHTIVSQDVSLSLSVREFVRANRHRCYTLQSGTTYTQEKYRNLVKHAATLAIEVPNQYAEECIRLSEPTMTELLTSLAHFNSVITANPDKNVQSLTLLGRATVGLPTLLRPVVSIFHQRYRRSVFPSAKMYADEMPLVLTS